MIVREHELLAFSFKSTVDPVYLIADLGTESCDNLRAALALLLVEHVKSGAQDLAYTVEEWETPHSFNSVVLKGGGYSDRQWSLAFNFRGGFSDTLLPLTGILIAVFGGPLTLATIPAALGVAKLLWGKLALLRGPEHAEAITLLDTLARLRAAARRQGLKGHPTWAEVTAEAQLDERSALTALRLLRAKSIVEIDTWGGQAEDLEDSHNRWKVSF